MPLSGVLIRRRSFVSYTIVELPKVSLGEDRSEFIHCELGSLDIPTLFRYFAARNSSSLLLLSSTRPVSFG